MKAPSIVLMWNLDLLGAAVVCVVGLFRGSFTRAECQGEVSNGRRKLSSNMRYLSNASRKTRTSRRGATDGQRRADTDMLPSCTMLKPPETNQQGFERRPRIVISMRCPRTQEQAGTGREPRARAERKRSTETQAASTREHNFTFHFRSAGSWVGAFSLCLGCGVGAFQELIRPVFGTPTGLSLVWSAPFLVLAQFLGRRPSSTHLVILVGAAVVFVPQCAARKRSKIGFGSRPKHTHERARTGQEPRTRDEVGAKDTSAASQSRAETEPTDPETSGTWGARRGLSPCI